MYFVVMKAARQFKLCLSEFVDSFVSLSLFVARAVNYALIYTGRDRLCLSIILVDFDVRTSPYKGDLITFTLRSLEFFFSTCTLPAEWKLKSYEPNWQKVLPNKRNMSKYFLIRSFVSLHFFPISIYHF